MRPPKVETVMAELARMPAITADPRFEAFARSYLRHAAGALAAASPREVTHFLRQRFEFLEGGQPDRITVTVENPQETGTSLGDEDGLSAAGPFVTRIEAHGRDRPFIMSTLQDYFMRRGVKVLRCYHPVLAVTRTSDGRIESVGQAEDQTQNESLVFLEVERVGDADDCLRVRNDLQESLQGVRKITEDFANLKAELANAVQDTFSKGYPTDPYAPEEIRAFLEWLGNENFVIQGYRYYAFTDGPEAAPIAKPETTLGVLRLEGGLAEFRTALEKEIEVHLVSRAAARSPLAVLRTDVYSRVHRAHPVDYVGVKQFSPEGRLVGERVFVGNFSNRTVTEKVANIPVLRRKTERAIEKLGLVKGTHNYRRSLYALNNFPKEDLFYSTLEELTSALEAVLAAEEVSECSVLVTRSSIGARISLVIVLPKFAYDSDVKASVYRHLCGFFGVDTLREYLCWSEEQMVRLHYYVSRPIKDPGDAELEALREELVAMVRPWRDKLAELLHQTFPGAEGERLAKKYRSIFREEYQSVYPPETAVIDAFQIETMLATKQPQCVLHESRQGGSRSSGTALKVYTERPVALNRIVPILANFGLQVLDEDYAVVESRGEGPAWIYSFHVTGADGGDIVDSADQIRVAEAVSAILRGDYSDQAVNSLILDADLEWSEVDILVAYRNYYLQLNKDYTPETVDGSLTQYPSLARLFLKYFRHRFHPDERLYGDRKHREETTLPAIAAEVKGELAHVSGIAEDKILRNFFNILGSTLRTSFFKPMSRPVLSLKIRSGDVWEMPEPRPWIETYVHAQKLEAIHLRGGPVARGGLRWTDRKDDFRTEVLELMKTQMTKNAVIVPVGAKGGFYPKLGNLQGKDRADEGLAQYRVFIRGLLEICDSYGPGGEHVRPSQVYCWDDFDPYLVVAADKGTATFSDFANELSNEYRFWLGDAFASGGSCGYSHKDLGITARGGWECVKRHFREMGKDIQTQDFTCVGIGDMAGDVFGNGMILSRHTKLLAAFNHKNIFLDPNPDPEASFQERQRLFDNPKLQWSDYDPAKISQGGGVFSRSAKVIALSPEVRAALGTDRDTVNGEELITIILRAPAELLWNGGIGTYIKASYENHHEVRDKTNDRVRVDARELRCKVIGEGGNLGLTQKARLEFASLGGRLNTDAIDNSGGVDLSDHEVNLKILMDLLQSRGKVADGTARNQLLRELTEEVIQLVLRHNYRQSLALSLDQLRSQGDPLPFVALVAHLEKEVGLNRRVESIGDDSSLLNVPVGGHGIPRPTLAILLAYSKREAFGAILASDLPDRPEVQRCLAEYFPKPVHARFGTTIFEHRLRREIIGTVLSNRVIDQAGMTYLFHESQATGKPVPEVVASYLLAEAYLDGVGLRSAVFALDNRVPAASTYRCLLGLESAIGGIARYLLSWGAFSPLRWDNLEDRKLVLTQVLERLSERLPETMRQAMEAQAKSLADEGMPAELARRIAFLPAVRHLLGLVRVAEEGGLELLDMAEVFFRVGSDLRFDWLQERAVQVTRANQWELQFLNRLSSELYFLQGEISKAAIGARKEAEPIGELLSRFYSDRKDRVQTIHKELERLAASGVNNLIPIDLFRDHYRAIVA